MATWEDVRAVAGELPGTTEESPRQWRVARRLFALERPLRRADLEHLGHRAPDEPPLALRVPDLGVKEALLAGDPERFLTTPHFDGYPMVLARLDLLDAAELRELVTEAWLSRAPRTVARRWLAEHPVPGDEDGDGAPEP